MEQSIEKLGSAPRHELSVSDAMELATEAHRAGYFEDAFKIYTRVLEAAPGHPGALHYLGIMAHEQGADEDALRLISRSVSLAPKDPGFRNNLGNLLLDLERFEDAEREYREALALDPDRPETLSNYAVLCKALGRFEESETCLKHALELVPNFTDARNNLARLYMRTGRISEAVRQATEALARDPVSAPSRQVLGVALCRSGLFDEAAKLYREWLAEEPDNPHARHHLAACTGDEVPPRASDEYVQSLFDNFAGSFDSKLAMLDYRAPGLVATAVSRLLSEKSQCLNVLDVGCGTGLCAPLIKPFAGELTGIDLSNGMLERARARGLYDALHQAELTHYLKHNPTSYDLIVSADTLVYFGDLDEALSAAARSLNPGGLICFTAEALGEGVADDYRLQHNGRYAHSRSYLESVLAQSGLEILALTEDVLRLEGGDPVRGWLALAQRPRE